MGKTTHSMCANIHGKDANEHYKKNPKFVVDNNKQLLGLC
jgi:hypothetical protein